MVRSPPFQGFGDENTRNDNKFGRTTERPTRARKMRVGFSFSASRLPGASPGRNQPMGIDGYPHRGIRDKIRDKTFDDSMPHTPTAMMQDESLSWGFYDVVGGIVFSSLRTTPRLGSWVSFDGKQLFSGRWQAKRAMLGPWLRARKGIANVCAMPRVPQGSESRCQVFRVPSIVPPDWQPPVIPLMGEGIFGDLTVS